MGDVPGEGVRVRDVEGMEGALEVARRGELVRLLDGWREDFTSRWAFIRVPVGGTCTRRYGVPGRCESIIIFIAPRSR